MAPGRAEPDFGLQGWIDTLGLKQIFLIYSVVVADPGEGLWDPPPPQLSLLLDQVGNSSVINHWSYI